MFVGNIYLWVFLIYNRFLDCIEVLVYFWYYVFFFFFMGYLEGIKVKNLEMKYDLFLLDVVSNYL